MNLLSIIKFYFNFYKTDSQYEPLVNMCFKTYIKKGDYCLDIGAAHGITTRNIARCLGWMGKVIAFEAHPGNANIIRKKLTFFYKKNSVEVKNLAVNDGVKETVTLFEGRDNSSFEFNIRGKDVEGNQTQAKMSVHAISIDNYVRENNINKLNFVKIDVEGVGDQVLLGMSESIKRFKPKILIELHCIEEKEAFFSLKNISYKFYNLKFEEIKEISKMAYHTIAIPN
jgi:FkbM family methyltransferase